MATVDLDADELRLIEAMTRFWLGGKRSDAMRFRLSALKAKVRDAPAPAPPVTPRLLAAAQAVVDDAVIVEDNPPLFAHGERCEVPTARIDALRAELAAATDGPVALTADGIARAFRAGELDWYLEYAPHVGTQCAVFDDMNARSQAATIAGAEAVLAIVRRTS